MPTALKTYAPAPKPKSVSPLTSPLLAGNHDQPAIIGVEYASPVPMPASPESAPAARKSESIGGETRRVCR